MTYEVTLTEEQIEDLVKEVCSAGFPEEYSFQNRFNRDAIAIRAQQNGAKVKRSSTPNQIIDPRYTIEGRHLPDKGLGNDKITTNLYHLERIL